MRQRDMTFLSILAFLLIGSISLVVLAYNSTPITTAYVEEGGEFERVQALKTLDVSIKDTILWEFKNFELLIAFIMLAIGFHMANNFLYNRVVKGGKYKNSAEGRALYGWLMGTYAILLTMIWILQFDEFDIPAVIFPFLVMFTSYTIVIYQRNPMPKLLPSYETSVFVFLFSMTILTFITSWYLSWRFIDHYTPSELQVIFSPINLLYIIIVLLSLFGTRFVFVMRNKSRKVNPHPSNVVMWRMLSDHFVLIGILIYLFYLKFKYISDPYSGVYTGFYQFGYLTLLAYITLFWLGITRGVHGWYNILILLFLGFGTVYMRILFGYIVITVSFSGILPSYTTNLNYQAYVIFMDIVAVSVYVNVVAWVRLWLGRAKLIPDEITVQYCMYLDRIEKIREKKKQTSEHNIKEYYDPMLALLEEGAGIFKKYREKLIDKNIPLYDVDVLLNRYREGRAKKVPKL